MKKILCTFALILTFACVLTSCNLPFLPGTETTVTTPEETTPETTLTHVWSEWIVVKEAKCEEKGLLQRYCTECYYTESKPIQATGHSFGEWITTKLPTLSEEGSMERNCVCGKKETQEIQKTPFSVGLNYYLNSDCMSYSVGGIGTCTDNDVIIPAEYDGLPVTTIGSYAFYKCSNLTSVTIGDSVTIIGDYAFEYCRALTSITIPDSVTTIGDSAFSDCSNLMSIIVDENNEAYQSVDGNLYSKDGTVLIAYAIGKADTSFVIPDSVTTIGDCAFCRCTNLASITIPDSVTTIGNYAFSGCSNLTSVTIPDSVTTIGSAAFYYCPNLTSVTIGDSVTTIGNYAFSSCSNLTDVYYTGSEADWAKITIGSSNYCLTGANRHYNYVPEE